ncbi:hypothetical protein CC86DRAFT_367742 [Ophiobolus disseminans]|uniref:Bromo domain-containing protein n=1 Tax=Ophiobolus disseminans TaxID=1469910 RepID=A0A6A7AB47_9PLEO|nr:hypothetical protein CC86DRAFT_367742 [Ophiobolus disseminans]
MNSSISAYTTLESLLLFQYLYAHGVGTSVFGKISDLLKQNPDITAHRYFQSGRLSPDALRNFYLERLRKEIDHEQGDNDGDTNGDVANPRKRKKASPALPSVQESLQHQHLIPKLVNKLYASFRKEVTDQIRADEERYEKLQRELESIKRGDWDEQLRERATAKTPVSQSPTLPRKSPHLAQKPLAPIASPQLGQNGARGNAPTPDGTPRAPAAQNGPPVTSPRKQHDQRPTPMPQPLASASPQPHLAQPLAPPPPRFQQPPNQQYSGPPYPTSPYLSGQHTPHSLPPQPSPQQHTAHTPHAQSPFIGPPGPPPHPHPVPVYGSNGPPQYGPPPGAPPQYSPGHQRFPPPPPGSHSPGVQTQHPQRPQYTPPLQQPYPPHGPQYAQPPPPPQAGFMLPPFQVAPQDPSRVHPQSAPAPHHPQVSTPVSNRQHTQSGRGNAHTPGSGRPGVPPMHPLVTQARQSFSTPVNNRSPLSAMGTPVSAKSMWKKSLSFAGTPAASSRPVVEPIDDFVPSTPKPSPHKAKAQRKPRTKGKGKEKETEHESADASATAPQTPSEPQPDDSVIEPETRSGRSRRKAAPKRTRPGSLASSRAGGSVRDRSRSQSILSHTETVAADNESQAGNRIKSERGTSVDAIKEESAETPPQMTTRRGAASRRKRTAREASLDGPEDQFSTPGPPRTIVAPRYFARTCAPIMNDIQSHKHASTFSSAVRAKDAEGYYDIIKRPTDLKSIQKAITIGSKQVQVAATDTPTGSPGGGGAVVELSMTSDNIPPKSIVNAAQLEKELMRMFVNAVMFNPGEDGVVEDARDMFETVQRSVSSWRNVERSSGRTEIEDTPTVEEEEAPPLGKRRKV